MITTGSDADSSGSVKIAANSIDGEDEIVNVTKQGDGSPETLATSEEVKPTTPAP